MTGGSTTPKYRTDVAFGGAARVPVGKLKDAVGADPQRSRYRETADAGGVVPLVYARYGITHSLDVGLMVAGTTVRVELRSEKLLFDGSTRGSLVFGGAVFGGWIAEEDNSGSGGRVGLDVPFAYAVDFGGVYELWLGARGGAEFASGNFDVQGARASAQATGLRIGPLIGMALGLRRVHVLLELTAAYEYWFVEHAGQDLDRGGFALVPAFALRIRI